MDNLIRVVCAIIVADGKILAAQRGFSKDLAGKWEFPGGKIEPHETPEQALVREIQEELHVQISIIKALPPTTHQYPGKKIRLLPYQCRGQAGEPVLAEHLQFVWCTPAELSDLDWAPADWAIVRYLQRTLRPS